MATHDLDPPTALQRLRLGDGTAGLVRGAVAARRHACHLRAQRDPLARDAEVRAATHEHAALVSVRVALLELSASLDRLTPEQIRAELARAHDHLEAVTP